MDSNSNHSYHHQNSQPGSGLLRFRSAPSSLLANFNDNGVTNDSVLNFQELEDKSAVRVREAPLSYANSQQTYFGLPPHYPRQSSATTTTMDSSYGLIGSMAMGHSEQAKRVDSNLARQNSTPAGLFSNLSVQNGTFCCSLFQTSPFLLTVMISISVYIIFKVLYGSNKIAEAL